MKKTILYIIVLFSISCQQENQDVNVLAYFDTEVFVQQEIDKILSKDYSIEKEIVLNGKTEFIKVETIDTTFLKNEFKLLKAGNINKPALLGKYEMDTIWYIDPLTLEDGMGFNFTPVNKSNTKLKTREVTVYKEYLSEVNKFVNLEIASSNFMHAYRKQLSYISEKEMIVKAWEKTMFQDTLFYETKLIFLKN